MRVPLLRLVASVACALPAGSARAGLPPGWSATPVHTQLAFPTTLRMAPDRRLFYLERESGRVMVFDTPAAAVPRVWATLPVDASFERGMLGMALHPAFPDSPFVYVYYTHASPRENRVVRLRDDHGTGTGYSVVVGGLPAYGMYHHGGRLAFGPDGALYVTLGDQTDPPFARDPGDIRGKILRYTPLGEPALGNPFGTGNPVFACGVRNPFGLAFDPLTSIAYFTDNGPTCDDRVERLTPGADYGWGDGSTCGVMPPGAQRPLAMYTPTIAPTGCVVYRGGQDPQFEGDLFFGSYNLASVARVHFVPGNSWAVWSIDETFVETFGDPVLDVTLGADGLLWFCTTSAIWRITPAHAVGVAAAPPLAFAAHPNPFATAVTFTLPAEARVLELTDASGRRVRAWRAGGARTVTWDGADQAGAPAPPGVYFARLTTAAGTDVRRLVRLPR